MPVITVRPYAYGGWYRPQGFGYWHNGLGWLGQDDDEVPVDTSSTYDTATLPPDIPLTTTDAGVPTQLPTIPTTPTTVNVTPVGTGSPNLCLDQTESPVACTSVQCMYGNCVVPTTPNTTLTSALTPTGSATVSSVPASMASIMQNPMLWFEEATMIPGIPNWMVMGGAVGIAVVGGMMLKNMGKKK
jgi:hypothetical protein